MLGRINLTAVLLVTLILSSSFVFPVRGADRTEPVPFEDTVTLGATSVTVQQEDAKGVVVPRLEVYYSGYEYVVGFYGLRSYLTEQRRTGHHRQFSEELAVYVTDFAGTNVSLTDDGYLQTHTSGSPDFVPAKETFVVVNSTAKTPSGPVAVPFSERGDAAAFAAEYDGEVLSWEAAVDAIDTSDVENALSVEAFDRRVQERSQWADARVAESRKYESRPVSVVVGENGSSLRSAIERAPPNTTVRLPPGTYNTTEVIINKSITLAGAGNATRIHGDGNGSVLHVSADDAVVRDLSIDGVGSTGSKLSYENGSDSSWSKRIELAYGRGDAAIELDGTDGALVENVTIDTPASGVITRNASGSVLRDLVIRGATRDGFMGVVVMYSPVVIEDSRFVHGRDAVYTHRADGVVVRDNEMSDGRFGVHLMYTSNSLVRNNRVYNETIGIVVMTNPQGNLIVGNQITDSIAGLSTTGSWSYYARNIVVGNERGIDVSGRQSLYALNTVVGNELGLRGSSILPTNLVTNNDVVGNEQTVESSLGPLRVWTVEGEGNYWGPMPAEDDNGDGLYDRAYYPTGPVDARLHETVGARTLARSPALTLLRSLQGEVPGLRTTGVVDTAPRVEPARPTALDQARNRTATERGAV
jgi:parallel beta-helix repeat protein